MYRKDEDDDVDKAEGE